MFARRRPLLRAAAVGGTAYMMGKRGAQRQAEAQQGEYAQEPQQAQQTQPAPGQDTGAAETSMTDELNRLATLHQQGALTDSEFAAAKAKLLGT